MMSPTLGFLFTIWAVVAFGFAFTVGFDMHDKSPLERKMTKIILWPLVVVIEAIKWLHEEFDALERRNAKEDR